MNVLYLPSKTLLSRKWSGYLCRCRWHRSLIVWVRGYFVTWNISAVINVRTWLPHPANLSCGWKGLLYSVKVFSSRCATTCQLRMRSRTGFGFSGRKVYHGIFGALSHFQDVFVRKSRRPSERRSDIKCVVGPAGTVPQFERRFSRELEGRAWKSERSNQRVSLSRCQAFKLWHPMIIQKCL